MYPRREKESISGGQNTLACAARVNKHWLVAARRSLYHKLQLTSWDSVILLSETLQFWNPRLREFIREISSVKLEDLASSDVPIKRIFSSLPNLRTLDARNISMQVDSRHLPSLNKLVFSHRNFRSKSGKSSSKCSCSNCSRALPKLASAPESTLEVLAAFPSASYVYASHTRFCRDTEASCTYNRTLATSSRLPIPTLAVGQSPPGTSLPALQHLCLDLPVFDLDHVSSLFVPLASSLRHLKLVRPKFSSVEYHAYEDAGITAILQAVGKDLVTFHCCTSNSIGSTAFRCLKSVKDLRYSALAGRMQTDIVDALPQTMERLDLRWAESDEFLHLLLSRLQEPEFLPSLKLAPFLRRACMDYGPSMQEPLRVRVAAARSHMESRGLSLSGPNFKTSLLAAPGYHGERRSSSNGEYV
jgi:hypothetical protein